MRRPEIVEDFDREVYGRAPKNAPQVKWEVVSTTPETNGRFAVVTKKLVGHTSDPAYPAMTADMLPVDAHELIALCAPRPVFISCGSPKMEGEWLDDRGQFQAAVAAGPVYRLLGKKDLGTSEIPPMETGLVNGELAFRQHSGGHTAGPNWPIYLTFASRYFGDMAAK